MPEIFAPYDIRATSSSGAAVIIPKGTTKVIGKQLALDAVRQGGIDVANLAELPKLKDETTAIEPTESKPPVEETSKSGDGELREFLPEDTGEAKGPPTVLDIISHPGDSDVVEAIIKLMNAGDPADLRSDGLPKSTAVAREAGRQIDKEERDAALEIVAKRLGR
jgi:hypothetical protein